MIFFLKKKIGIPLYFSDNDFKNTLHTLEYNFSDSNLFFSSTNSHHLYNVLFRSLNKKSNF